MCSQFDINLKSIDLEVYLNVPIAPTFELQTQVFPGYKSIILIKSNLGFETRTLVYGLSPKWAKPKAKFATYNARIETIFEKPTWRDAIRSKRCLIPLTSFSESIYDKEYAGHLVKFSGAKDAPLIAAGVYDETGFAIITREPLEFVGKAGHDRSPIFMHHEFFKNWLGTHLNGKDEEILKILQAQADDIELKVQSIRELKGHDKQQLKLF